MSISLIAISHAAAVAAKNVGVIAPAVATAAAGVALGDVVNAIGPRGVCVFFALLGVIWRWQKLRLPIRRATSEGMISAVFAFIIGDAEIFGLKSIFATIRPESVPMLNGIIIGIANVTIIAFVSDFIAQYRATKGDKS